MTLGKFVVESENKNFFLTWSKDLSKKIKKFEEVGKQKRT